MIYLHPFGSTQPENIEYLRDDSNPPDMRDPPERRGPVFIFFDQEPLNFNYNQTLFDHIKHNVQGPFILVNTERDSEEKTKICKHYGFAHVDYFFHIFAATDWYRGHSFLYGVTAPKDRVLNKTFITFNRLTSNERIYRSLFINELYKHQLLDSGHVSFSKYCPDGGDFAENLAKGIANQGIKPALVAEAIDNISQLPELRIDFKQQDIPNQSMLLSPIESLMESFLFVVTETCYWQQKTHLTEKIFKPIVLQMPFVLVGCAHNLKYLRSYGFKTFGDFWDESYDDIEDPILRLQAIVKVIETINQLTADEQKNMLLKMIPILEHNYNLFNDPAFAKREWDHLITALTEANNRYHIKPPYVVDVDTKQRTPIDVPI